MRGEKAETKGGGIWVRSGEGLVEVIGLDCDIEGESEAVDSL